jgi:hypothetical protein
MVSCTTSETTKAARARTGSAHREASTAPTLDGQREGVGVSTSGRTYTQPVTQPETSGPLQFACPRCGSDAVERFYGPCPACRDDLRVRLAGVAREVEAAAFEPSMHVTPNAVAQKE